MADYRRNEIISGLFVVLAVFVFSLFAFKIGDIDLFGIFRGKTQTCVAYFTDVQSLDKRALVKVGGQTVGQVKNVRMVERKLTPDQVKHLKEYYERKAGLNEEMFRQLIEVEFELDNPELRLNPETARVTLGQDSPLAPHFLELDPGEWSTKGEVRTIFEANLGDVLTVAADEGTGFEELVALLKPAVRRANDILAKIDASLLTPKNTEAIENVLRDFAQVSQDAKRITNRLDGIVDQELESKIGTIVSDLAVFTEDLQTRFDQIQGDLHELLANANHVVSDNRAEIAEITRRMRRSMWQAEMALRKIRSNPAVLLFGDNETDLQALQMDETWIRESARARPYEQRDETDESSD